jgi:ribose-phosphate pyrophosphokinase
MALHAPQVHGFFSVPVDHLTAIGVLADHFLDRDLSDYVVVSPDLGNAKQATLFARLLGLPVAAGASSGSGRRQGRDRRDRRRRGRQARDRARRRDRHRWLDRRTPGQAAEAGCPSAAVACTHGLFAGSAVQRLSTHPMITEVVTTDTVPRPAGFGALHVRSVSRLFAEAIGRIHVGESVSSLFDGVDPAHASPQRQLPLYDGYESFDDGYADAGGHLFSGSRHPFEPGQASRSSAAGRPVESPLRPVVSEPVPLLSVAEPQLDDAEALS